MGTKPVGSRKPVGNHAAGPNTAGPRSAGPNIEVLVAGHQNEEETAAVGSLDENYRYVEGIVA